MMNRSCSNGNLECGYGLLEIEALLLQHRKNRDLNLEKQRSNEISRSGSAPPTVRSAYYAVENLFNSHAFENVVGCRSSISSDICTLTDDQIRSESEYLDYYFSHENLNPRLPPPLLSKEDLTMAQMIKPRVGRTAMNNDQTSLSLKMLQERKPGDEFVGLKESAMGNLCRRNSSELLQNVSFGVSKSGIGVRRKSFADVVQEGISNGNPVKAHFNMEMSSNLDPNLRRNAESLEYVHHGDTFSNLHTRTIRPSSTSCNAMDPKGDDINPAKSSIFEIGGQSSLLPLGIHGAENRNYTHLRSNLASFPRRVSSMAELHSPDSNFSRLENIKTPLDLSRGKQNGYLIDIRPDTIICTDPNKDSEKSKWREAFLPAMFPNQMDYPQHALDHGRVPTQLPGEYGAQFVGNLDDCFENFLIQQMHQYHSHILHKSGYDNLRCHGSPAFVPPAATYLGNISASFQLDSRMPVLQCGKNSGIHQDLSMRGGTNFKGRSESLLQVFRNDYKTKCWELSDILGHVVEFSKDQVGSRFIQQNLEKATTDERAKIFAEIITDAKDLMTDVFGNYVVQKFLQHGNESQQKELANQMAGHILSLSLHTYGCRVVQKALEVLDSSVLAEAVKELSDSVMKCVHNQNGNHVIQKCIECVPQHCIQFITSSFMGQVFNLSTHPYGCRVIQKLLRHCDDPQVQKFVMDEILSSVSKLAQHQYGNYVIQHIVQHGKPEERSMIIHKLAGKIVKMSLQKYSSNVVEKCLTFGIPEERALLVNQMLGLTDETGPFQAMVKDQFGNYVVQKAIETCDEKNRELILSRIKVQLDMLKRYTYGKHVVSRFEKLVEAGERQAVQ